jgi:hypothetical protein
MMMVILVSSSIFVADVLHVLMVCFLVGRDFAFCKVGKTWGILSKVTGCTGWAIDYRETFACEHERFFHESLFVLKMAIIHRKM